MKVVCDGCARIMYIENKSAQKQGTRGVHGPGSKWAGDFFRRRRRTVYYAGAGS